MQSLRASLFDVAVDQAERGRIPDPLLRAGIRGLLRQRLREIDVEGRAAGGSRGEAVRRLAREPVAAVPELANAQHYEVPPAFFRAVLGPRLKYSACLFERPGDDLARAEEAMLELTCRRAGVADGMRVLDLGCGWGSFALYAAEHFPGAQVVAVSNSKDQGESIRAACDRRGLRNLDVRTADVNDLDPVADGGGRFDRIVSVEMFEHVRNWGELLGRAADWVRPDGRLFLHTFCHRDSTYFFEDRGSGDWMARHFFSGGIMPAADLVLWHADRWRPVDQWLVSGLHYARTCEAWLARLDADRGDVREALGGGPEAERALHRWRLFFLACAELFRFRGGREWFVQHVLLAPRHQGGRA